MSLARPLLVATLATLAAPLGALAAAPADRSVDHVEGSYIVVYRDTVGSPSAETDRRERTHGFKAEHRYARAIKGFAADLSPGQLRQLQADPEVAFVRQQRRLHAIATVPLALGDSAPLGVRRVEAATAITAREASTANVAVIDSGISLGHPDLNAVSGKNCVGGGPAEDDNGHGSHVAGSIGARNNGSGVVGVAPNTKLYAVKVLNASGSGTDAQVICGIDWATATRTDADPANDVRVANMSLGGVGPPVQSCAATTDPMHRAICNSTSAGVSYVVAAGNAGYDFDFAPSPDTPAAYPQVITVTAMGDSDGSTGSLGAPPSCRTGEADDRYASFSNFALTAAGRAHTVAGPGVCIYSTYKQGGYATISGTSMSSPHVAGITALCVAEAGTNGPCAGLPANQPSQYVQQIAKTTPSYGFDGDPTRPFGTRYYGYLASAGVPAPPDTTPPAAPTGLAATAGVGSVALDWADSPATDLAGYDVYRSTASGGPYSKVNSSRLTASAYNDPGLMAGTTYYYVVRAVDTSNNESANSAQASATPTAPPASAYRQAVLATTGLLSYWRLGETSGTTAVDLKGGRDGTYQNGTALGLAGALTGDPDRAAGFDGVDDRVQVPDLAPPASVSLEAWVYPQDTSTGTSRMIIDKGNTEYGLRIDDNGNLLFASGSPVQAVSDTGFNYHTPANANRWYHVAVAFDASTDTVRFYRDGALTQTATGFTVTIQDTTPGLRIGRHSSFNFGTFNGRVDEAAVYGTALPTATVQNHYAAGTGP